MSLTLVLARASMLLLAVAAVAGTASATHDACRGGTTLGGGFDPGTGLYDWTCATENTNWHGSVDATQQTASYLITCTGPGTPHPTCLDTEDRMIGAVHQIGMAAARTRPGGTVYVPNFAGKSYAIWVDDGCGTLSDGTTRAKCPPAHTARWRSLTHFAQSGPHVRGDRVQANRGVKIVAEGTPSASVNGSGYWELSGGWLVVDTGNSFSQTKGPAPLPLDGPDNDLAFDRQRFITGGAKWPRYCKNSDNNSLACDVKGEPGSENKWSGEDVWIYGAASSLETNHTSGDPIVCLDNGIKAFEETTMGTCRGDRRYRCWDANSNGNTDEDRTDGSCIWTGIEPNVDLGPCDGFVDALAEDLPTDPDIRLVFQLAQCTQPAAAPVDCTSAHGHASFMAEIASVPAIDCNVAGKTVELLPSGQQPVTIPGYAVGGGGANMVHVTRASLYDQTGGGFYNFGFMPGNYFRQVHAGDVKWTGTTTSSGVPTTLSFASPGWVTDEWQGFTAVIDPLGVNDGPMYQTIASNNGSTLTLTMSTNDTECNGECTEPGNAGVVTSGDVVEIRGGMCSGSFHGAGRGTSDEIACDQMTLTGNFAGQHAGFYNSLHFLCSAPNGGPSCADSNSLNLATGRYWNGTIWRAARGFVSDLSGDHMNNYSFLEGTAGTFLQNFSSYGVNENIEFIDNDYRQLIQVGSQNVTGAIFRNIVMDNNHGGGAAEILISTVQDLTMQNVQSTNGTQSTFMIIRPFKLGAGTETSDASNIVLRDITVSGELGERFGDSGPSAAIWIDVNGDGDDTESIDGLLIENASFTGDGPDQCGIWLEDNHSPGATQPMMEESRPSMTFRNIFATGASGIDSAICVGNTEGAPHDDASTSADARLQTFFPTLENFWQFSGDAEGGDIFFVVEGVSLQVTTSSGDTADDVAAAVAAVINADSQLSAKGISASAQASDVSLNGNVSGVVVTDPGIRYVLGPPPAIPVPALGSASLLMLVAMLAGTAFALPRPAR